MADRISIRLAVDGDQAEQAFKEFARTGESSVERIRLALGKLGDGAKVSIDKIDPSLAKLQGQLNSLRGRYDENFRAQRDFAKAQDIVNRSVAELNLPMAEGQRLLGLVSQGHRTLARDSTTAAVSTGQTRFALQNLSFQLNDIATSLASGGSPMRVLAQQGGQVVQVFQQGGGVSSVLGAARTAIAGMITPTTAAVAGMAALAGGIGLVLGRAGQMEAQARSFTVVLEAMGTAAQGRGADFVKMTRDLQAMGLAADDARAALLEVLRTPGVNPAQAGRIGAAGANIAAGLGGDTTARVKELAAAIAKGVEGIIDYGIATRTLDHIQAGQIRKFAETAGGAAAVNRAFELIEQTVAGRLNRTLSTMTRTMTDVKDAFRDMWDALAVTGPAQTGIRALEHAANVIAAIAQGKAVFLNLPGMGQMALNEAAAAARAAADRSAPINPGASALPGATNSFDPRGLALNTAELQRLSAVLDAAIKHLPAGYALLGTAAAGKRPGTPGSLHPSGAAVDVQLVGPGGPIPNRGADATGMYERLAAAAWLENRRLFPGTSLAWGGRFGVRPGSTEADLMHFDAGQDRGTLRPPLADLAARYRPQFSSPTAADARAGFIPSAADVTAGYNPALLNDMGKQIEWRQKLLEADKMVGQGATWWRTYWQEVGAGETGAEQRWAAMAKANDAVEAHRIALDKSAGTQKLSNELGMETARAYGVDLPAGLRAAAMAQAELDVRQNNAIDVQTRYNELIQTAAVEAAKSSAQAMPALTEQIAAAERIAAAELHGAAAVQEAERAEQVRAKTRELAAHAAITGDQAIRAGLTQQIALIDKISMQEQSAANKRAANALKFQQQQDLTVAQAQRQLALETDPSRIQAGQLAIQGLQDEFTIRQRLKGASEEQIQAELRMAGAIRQTAAETQAFNAIRDKAKAIADDIGQFFIDSFVNIDKGGKSIFANLMDAVRAGFKRMIANIAVDFAKQQFIIPILTSIVGGAPGLFGITSPANASGGGINAGTLLQGGGLLKDIFGINLGGEGGLLGGVTGWLDGIGASSGLFGAPGMVLSTELGSWSARAAPGLLGSGSFSSFLGGAGLGFGAGSLLNSLVGGNSTFGTVGSGLGSLAGAAIGSIIPGIGTLIGGLIGGAGGGLFGGMFGNNRPRNASAGGNIDFATGRVFDMFAGGNPQIDQATAQVIQQLGGFTQRLLQLSGGRLSGEVLLQNGVNTGFTADSSLPGFEGRFNLGRDPGEVVRTVSLALSRSLTDISDVMRHVIGQVGDPAKLESALQFAAAYERIDEAFKDAFATVEADAQKVGPFAQAMEQIRTTFTDLTAKAGEFGLALDPLNAGLAEATRRLQKDFTDSLDRAFNEASGAGFVNQLRDLSSGYTASLAEAQAVGLGDAATQARIAQVYQAQIENIFAGLDTGEIAVALDAFAGLDATMLQLMQSAEAAAQATLSLAEAEQQAQAIIAAGAGISDYVASLGAAAPGLSPEAALAGAQSLYAETLMAAQLGDVDAYQDLVAVSQQLLEATEAYYASSPETAAAVAQVASDLLALPGVAEGADINELTLQLIDAQNQTTDAILTLERTTQLIVETVSAGLAELLASNDQATAAALAAIAEQTALLTAANSATATALIAQNDADTAELLSALQAGAAEIIAQNDAATAELLSALQAGAAETIAQNDADTAELIAALHASAGEIIIGNNAASAALIEGNSLLSAEIVALNDMLAETLFDANVDAASGIIAANDGTTAAIIAQYSASANELLAGASDDAQAVAASVYDIGDEISLVVTSGVNSLVNAGSLYSNSEIAAVLGGASSIVEAAAGYSNSEISAITGGANSLVGAGAEYAAAIVQAVTNGANSLVGAGAEYAAAIIQGITSGANSLVGAGAEYAAAIVQAVTSGANGVIGAGAEYANSTIAGFTGAISSLIDAEGVHANNQLAATYATAPALVPWLEEIRNVLVGYGDHGNAQRDSMISLLTQLRDAYYAYQPPPPYYDGNGDSAGDGSP